MNENEYASICVFVEKNSGIVLGSSKSYLIESRLAPVAEKFGHDSVAALAGALRLADPVLGEAVIDAMTTNESFFFRDTTPFTAFEDVILPALIKSRRGAGRLRIWCAAASTGQEPYSLAMVLLATKKLWAGMKVEIIATDLSLSALERAKSGVYSQFEVQRGLPIKMLVEHFTQDGTNWNISDEIKSMVTFKRLNLLESFNSIGTADLVFCRNVLIYFDVPTKKKVIDAIGRIMPSDGYLVLGASETMMGITDSYVRSEGYRGLFQPTASGQRAMTG